MDTYINYLEGKALKHLVIDGAGRVPIDHADSIKSAAYYIGSWLVAKRPINVYSSTITNGIVAQKIIKTIPTGGNVGRVFSYVSKPDSLWWQLEGASGNGTGGFVKHETGAFDNTIALDTSSGKEHKENVERLKELTVEPLDKVTTGISKVVSGVGDSIGGIGKTLTGLGDNLPLILIGITALLIATAIYRVKSL